MTPQSDSVISVSQLSKMYKVYSHPSDLFWEMVSGKPKFKPFWALRDVSFKVSKGEVLGVVGRNGSGKSTLLRILAGTLDKTDGLISINGRISAILELGTGFNPEYTGRENIRLGCIYQGMIPRQVQEKMEWIIDFSELRDFIDQPFKTYSSGMQARLTFATAVSVDPDIFIVDEALAAGDSYFINKSLSRIREICNSGSTVLFVSHSTGVLTSLCDRAIWLDGGSIHRIGDTRPVVREYEYEIHKALSAGRGQIDTIKLDSPIKGSNQTPTPDMTDPESPSAESTTGSDQLSEAFKEAESQNSEMIFRKGPIFIDMVEFLDHSGSDVRVFRRWQPMTIRVNYHCNGELPRDTLGMAVGIHRKSDLLRISHFSSGWVPRDNDLETYADADFRKRPGFKGVIECTMDPIQLVEGEYLFSVGLTPNNPVVVDFYEQRYEAYTIAIMRDGHELAGLIYYPCVKWAHFPEE